MAVITIIGSGMMGSALAFPARENGHEVRLVGTHLDKEIIAACKKTDKHLLPNGQILCYPVISSDEKISHR